MRNSIINAIDLQQIRKDIPNLQIGQNIKVNVRIKEGNKERIQVFEGLIIAIKGTGLTQTFIVRKISYGVGVERTFLVNSPLIASIVILKSNKIRRAKLYYMRDRKGKSARMKEIIKVSNEPSKKSSIEKVSKKQEKVKTEVKKL